MKLTHARLAELQALNLPTVPIEAFKVSIPEGASEEDKAKGRALIAEIEKYLTAFTPMKDGNLCICCGAPQGASDPIHALLTGSAFVWGIAHGEGQCRKCGYPARAMHYLGDWLTIRNLILQYHPSGLSLKAP